MRDLFVSRKVKKCHADSESRNISGSRTLNAGEYNYSGLCTNTKGTIGMV